MMPMNPWILQHPDRRRRKRRNPTRHPLGQHRLRIAEEARGRELERNIAFVA